MKTLVQNREVFTFSILTKVLLILCVLTWMACQEEAPSELRNELVGYYQTTATCLTCNEEPKSVELRIYKAGDDGKTITIAGLRPVSSNFYKVNAHVTTATAFEFYKTENACTDAFAPCNDIHNIHGHGSIANNKLIMMLLSNSFPSHDYRLEGFRQ
ncbi:MAG: hypothetical protein ACR2MX_06440 [Cyclobacteriaceae bacterium]